MDRIDVLLRADVRADGPVLTEVWYDHHRNGERIERLQLREAHADPHWADWERTLVEATVRAQLSLF